MRRVLLTAVVLLVLGAAFTWLSGRGTFGEIDGVVTKTIASRRSPESVAFIDSDRDAAGRILSSPSEGSVESESQILFGDFHVHTTLSSDAFMMNLPMMGGAGAMTPADACDFARHCAALDFWSVNDHANSLHPQDWKNTIAAIRSCNERAGDPMNPDTVAFLGWEWTQSGLTPDAHYGHKNIVLAHTDDARIPTRPIAAMEGGILLQSASPFVRGALSVVDGRFNDLSSRIAEYAGADYCGEGDVRSLPDDCREVAPTPADLYRKLDEWGHESIVIPHGTAWGIYTPPQSSWDKQLEGAMHDPDRQTMLEVYSGHGDSEVYRDWRAATASETGELECPEERADYLPACRQAGKIVLRRCLDEGLAENECESRAARARQHALTAGKDYVVTIDGSDAREWLDAGQCRDCAQPSFNYVPTGSAQYIAAIGNFDEDPDAPRRFRMGFMASSDNHSARSGSGYKELLAHTDGSGDRPENMSSIATRLRRGSDDVEKPALSKAITIGKTSPLTALRDAERGASFQYTGGLVAVHANGRDRGSIWKSLEKLAVYGTSGPRILLWFDLLTEGGELPMGTEIVTSEVPKMRVRAVGSREQKPGCPEGALDALGTDEIERLCLGECYHPSDMRRPIERIDLVRIRPQIFEGEDVGSLVDDPWRSFDCPADPNGCTATFSDESFQAGGRDVVYYARVFESPKPTANGNPLNCTRDDQGRCLAVNTCVDEGDCLAPDRPRAWSSPIYVDHPDAKRSR